MPTGKVSQMFVDWFWAVVMYLDAVQGDGDTQNDWLTHLPMIWRPIVQGLGEWLVGIPSESAGYVWTAIHFVMALWYISQ